MTDISNAPVESWDIDKIIPYEKNHKKHPPAQVKALAASISDQGLNDPITVDKDGEIISGHGRLEAIKSLGWMKAPVRCLRDLTKEQAAKLRIAANKTSGNDYDVDILQEELERLAAAGEELTNIGLDDRELEMMLSDLGAMNDEMVIDDIELAVDEFEDEIEDSSKEAEASDIPISKAFDIKRLPLRAKKTVGLFMRQIERASGKEGADALLAHMDGVING